jgi:hypothetical protein
MARGPKRRHVAAYLADSTCPRCGAPRERRQAYCVECGLRLPVESGAIAAWRRGWMRRLGWYPGDWVWTALLAALVAAGGAAAAIAFDRSPRAAAAVTTYVAPVPRTSTPVLKSARNGRIPWPEGVDGWTVVLQSSPASRGLVHPQAVAVRAAHDGLPQVGVLESSSYASLHPGYYVVFSGVYGIAGDARTALATVRSRGFAGAYVLRVSP